MNLIIVESPTKTKTISKYIGENFKVLASYGHIRDLPKNNKNAINLEKGFLPHYKVIKGKEKIINELKKETAKAKKVFLATDPDREGEAIAWHLKEVLNLQYPKAVRITFNEITRDAILKSFENERDIDINLKRSQEARRVLDRLFGYEISELIWKKVRYGLSGGRVQSPALRIIMEREREIRSFVPQKYFIISGTFKKEKEDSIFTLICDKEITKEEELKKINELALKEKWKIIEIKKNEVKQSPKPPFITSTFQQAANTLLGLSPAKAMQVSQKLYESGLITYMRTDSPHLAKESQEQIISYIKDNFGENYAQLRTYKATSKVAQEAHEAIRPTNINLEIAGESEIEKKVYHLIWKRTIASQMSDTKILRTKITAQIEGNKEAPTFSRTISEPTFLGWKKIYFQGKTTDKNNEEDESLETSVEEKKILLSLKENDILNCIELKSEEKETQPPPRYTEAGLIKELEKRGIGRPSTYAAIIKTLQQRGYVKRIKRTLYPTDTGEIVSTFLEQHFKKYISDNFTAEMEDELDKIAEGKLKYEEVLSNFYYPFKEEIKSKENIEKLTTIGEASPEFKCPLCNGPMVIKLGKGGKFLSCANYPQCKGALTIEGKIPEAPKELEEKCPQCKEGNLVEKSGKYGKFIACSRYPKCKYIKQPEPIKTGTKCPKCQGEIVEKKGRYGIFYPCSNYPQCSFALNKKPTGNICPLCQNLMVEDKKKKEKCSNKECPNYDS